MSAIDAVILAGGLGARLQTVVGDRPKPLAEIQGRPFLDILVDDLLHQGMRRIVLCVGHRREQIIAHLQTRNDAEFLFSEEVTPLGTGGAVAHAAPLIKSDPFLLLNGDSFCAVDYAALLAFHHAKAAALTMVLAQPAGRADAGNVQISADGRITAFHEKSGGTPTALINAGIYLLPSALPATWQQPAPFSLERDIFPALIASHGCYGYPVKSEVIDIGTPQRYADAQHKL
jgi:NDP-sugar pyrophosphorylase family protein